MECLFSTTPSTRHAEEAAKEEEVQCGWSACFEDPPCQAPLELRVKVVVRGGELRVLGPDG